MYDLSALNVWIVVMHTHNYNIYVPVRVWPPFNNKEGYWAICGNWGSQGHITQ